MTADRSRETVLMSKEELRLIACQDVLSCRERADDLREEIEASPLGEGRRESYLFAVADVDSALLRQTKALFKTNERRSGEDVSLALHETEVRLLSALSEDVEVFARSIRQELDRSTFRKEPGDDDPTVRRTRYPTLAEKSTATSQALANLCGKLGPILRRPEERWDEGFRLRREEVGYADLVLMQLEERLSDRNRWLTLEVEALSFLDTLARFRELCILFERVMKHSDRDPRSGPAREELKQRLQAMGRELASHSLGRPLARLCNIQALNGEANLRSAMGRIVEYEQHALLAYGIPFHASGYLDKNRLNIINGQQHALGAFKKRVAFLQAFFAE